MLALVVLAVGCGSPLSPEEPRPNIVLILLDTVSARDLSVYDPTRVGTPNIDRLASQGRVFQSAYSTAPWTKPSVASLFTSQMPSAHGVQQFQDVLAEDQLTLAEVLQRQGYQTVGVVAHSLLGSVHGYGQGFDVFDESPVGGHFAITSAKVTDAATSWIASRGEEAPLFLLAHYFDAHLVYHHHEEFSQTSGYRGELSSGMEVPSLRDRRATLEPADIEYLRGLHQEEIALVDAEIGRLLGAVSTSLRRPTMVILAADHGEEIMDRGWLGHTVTLYDELIRVPLIVAWPGHIQPDWDLEPVSNLDVAPTIVTLAGLDQPADGGWTGRALFDSAGQRQPEVSRDLIAEVRISPNKWALMRGPLKLIHDQLENTWELYDRSSDPHERHNLFGERPARRLQHSLLEWERAAAARKTDTVRLSDPVAAEQLRSLGYVR